LLYDISHQHRKVEYNTMTDVWTCYPVRHRQSHLTGLTVTVKHGYLYVISHQYRKVEYGAMTDVWALLNGGP